MSACPIGLRSGFGGGCRQSLQDAQVSERRPAPRGPLAPLPAMDRTYRRDDGRIVQVHWSESIVTSSRGDVRVMLRFAEVDGRLECVCIEVGADFTRPDEPDPIPLTSTLLRELKIGEARLDAAR